MRSSAPDLKAIPEGGPDYGAGALEARASRPRRHRVSHSRLAAALPAYDIRVRRELAHRRTLIALGRHVTRIATLHLLDACAILLAIRTALRVMPTAEHGALAFILTGLTLIGLQARGAYRAAHNRRDTGRILSGVLVGVCSAMLMSRLPGAAVISIPFLVLAAPLMAVALLCDRAILDFVVRQAYIHGVGLRRALIVGTADERDMVAAALGDDSQKDHLIVGHVTPGSTQFEGALGSLVELEAVIQREEPAEVILCSPLAAEAYHRVADICVRNGVAILAIPSWTKEARGWAEPTLVGRMPAFWLHPVRLEVPSLLLKRATDLIITSILLITGLPIIALIGIAIKLDSRGPAFFRQRRVGLGGREFTMWKFRSMQREAERDRDEVAHLNSYADARLFKLRSDPRVTRVGRWLRRFSLDELPQLFNVLAGDMSLVGPRPPLPSEVKRYEQRHFVRLTVVPGMTGPWQVSGRNLITDFEEVVRLEREYVETWSFRLDLRIMLKTIGVMISGEGAY